jgi:drug/metabolite transporter (DMT)-like permease
MSLEAFLVLAAMGIFQLSVPYVLFIQGLKTVPAAEGALITLVEPILNPVWVWLAVGEQPGRSTLVGGALILVALVVCFLKPAQKYEPEQVPPDV